MNAEEHEEVRRLKTHYLIHAPTELHRSTSCYVCPACGALLAVDEP